MIFRSTESPFWTLFGRPVHTLPESVMDDITPPPQLLFIVRIWRVDNRRDGAWRGSVEHVPSGRKLYFTSLGDLNDFVALQLAASDNPLSTEGEIMS